jgi:hypothetical protein
MPLILDEPAPFAQHGSRHRSCTAGGRRRFLHVDPARRAAEPAVTQDRSVSSPDPVADAAAESRRQHRAAALERELFALRRLRAEVELMQPGLLLDRLEGWHSGAAVRYAERVLDVRLGLAGSVHLLGAAEHQVEAALERVRARGALS